MKKRTQPKLTRPRSADALRQAAEVALGRPIPDHVWQALIDKRFVGTCLDDELTDQEFETYFDRLVDAADLAIRVAGQRRREPQMMSDDTSGGADPAAAVVRWQADQAAQHPDVQWLWRDVFAGTLLPKRRRFLGEPLQPGELDRTTFLMAAAERCGGTIAGLGLFIKQLAEELAARYHWPVEEAEEFLFTKEPPHIPRWKMRAAWHEDAPLLSTIIIEANVCLKPKELAKAFGAYQRMLFQFYRLRDSNRRRRPLSEKHQALAIFAASRRDMTGAAAMAEWNTTHSEWAYRSVTNFQRDRMAALRRMFGEGEKGADDASTTQ